MLVTTIFNGETKVISGSATLKLVPMQIVSHIQADFHVQNVLRAQQFQKSQIILLFHAGAINSHIKQVFLENPLLPSNQP